MTAFRILAGILAIVFLAMALGFFFYREPLVVKSTSWLWQGSELKSFVESNTPDNMVLKKYLVYILRMSAVISVGVGLMFAISACKPLIMRPFIVVVIITLILGIAMDIYCGITIEGLSPYWWAIDAGSGALLVVLLLVFFPKAPPQGGYVYPEDEEDYLEE